MTYHAHESNVYYEYTEFISKNNQHRYKDINSKNKVVRVYAQIGSEHCIVKLLDAYLAKLKPDSFFYMCPLEKVPEQHGKSWYTSQRVGINTLKGIIPKLSLEAGCDVKYTNHSLQATSATRMFSGRFPKKLITDKTGHRSLQSLRTYESTQPSIEKAIDRVIANPTKSVSTKSDFREDRGIGTKYATQPSAGGKQNSGSNSTPELVHSTVCLAVFKNSSITFSLYIESI